MIWIPCWTESGTVVEESFPFSCPRIQWRVHHQMEGIEVMYKWFHWKIMQLVRHCLHTVLPLRCLHLVAINHLAFLGLRPEIGWCFGTSIWRSPWLSRECVYIQRLAALDETKVVWHPLQDCHCARLCSIESQSVTIHVLRWKLVHVDLTRNWALSCRSFQWCASISASLCVWDQFVFLFHYGNLPVLPWLMLAARRYWDHPWQCKCCVLEPDPVCFA